MADAPYTAKRFEQYRGPQSSDDYNARVEENYKDLTWAYNKVAQTESDLSRGYISSTKELLALSQFIDKLEARCAALESAGNNIYFTSETQVDNERFNATPFAVQTVDRCTFRGDYNQTTLPLVATSSQSKIRFVNGDGTYNIPASLQTLVVPIPASADNTSAVIDTSQPFNAIANKAGRVWERNVIASAPNLSLGAQMYFYVGIPNDLSAVADTNALLFNTFPMKSVDVLEIAYSTDVNITLGSVNGWTIFNSDQIYFNAPGAPGKVMPGAWAGDAALACGPKMFYFDPKPITAIRFKLQQMNYYTESTKTIYSYGMSKLDIRYDKFLDTGKMMVRFDAPSGKTISTVPSVTPQIWNIPEFRVNDVFSYRVVWETSFGSNSYTLTPVPSSKRVWLEVTLKKSPNNGTPSLSGLILKYT